MTVIGFACSRLDGKRAEKNHENFDNKPFKEYIDFYIYSDNELKDASNIYINNGQRSTNLILKDIINEKLNDAKCSNAFLILKPKKDKPCNCPKATHKICKFINLTLADNVKNDNRYTNDGIPAFDFNNFYNNLCKSYLNKKLNEFIRLVEPCMKIDDNHELCIHLYNYCNLNLNSIKTDDKQNYWINKETTTATNNNEQQPVINNTAPENNEPKPAINNTVPKNNEQKPDNNNEQVPYCCCFSRFCYLS